jgi:hypothetical protein
MEFQLKEGWFDYLMSGFFFGIFMIIAIIIYYFGSISWFPYDTYLLLLFAAFVGFIVTFAFGSHKSSNQNSSMKVQASSEYKSGYESARDAFQFSISCYVCGRPIIISDQSSVSNQAKSKLKELRIRHNKCQLEVKP